MKKLIKFFLDRFGPLRRVIDACHRYIHRGQANLDYTINLTSPLSIMAGPFRGMNYVSESHGSSLHTKLIGTYEAELHPLLLKMISMEPKIFIDIGCAEGYYAIGFKLRSPQSECIAYDTSSKARELCTELAALNDVSVLVRNEFKDVDFEQCCGPLQLVMADIEGFEEVLFSKENIKKTVNTHFIIEYHPHRTSLSLDDFVRRFDDSHEIQVINNIPSVDRPRRIKTPFDLNKLGYFVSERIYDERRDVKHMNWVYASPKTK